MKTLSIAQKLVLSVAAEKMFISFLDAIRVGGNGRTLSALAERALLTKNSYPDGSNDWSITETGRAAIATKEQA